MAQAESYIDRKGQKENETVKDVSRGWSSDQQIQTGVDR